MRSITHRKPTRRLALLAGAGAVMAATPIALAAAGTSQRAPMFPIARTASSAQGKAIRGGIHNPAYTHYHNTTGIFAKNPTWTTRVENMGHGGAATFLCHSSPESLPCVGADNMTEGLAFVFESNGKTGGQITLSNSAAAPFTTNAHGVATGLNANFLEGRQAGELQLKSEPAANANELGGQPASAYATQGQLLFADVVPGTKEPTISSTRGATAVTRSEPTEPATEEVVYTVTFGTTDVSKCSDTASPQGKVLGTGQLGVEPAPKEASSVVVSAPAEFDGGFDLQLIC